MVARVQGQLAGTEDDSDTSDENVPLPVLKSAQVISGWRHHRLRNQVNRLMCRDGKLEDSLKCCGRTPQHGGVVEPCLAGSSSM